MKASKVFLGAIALMTATLGMAGNTSYSHSNMYTAGNGSAPAAVTELDVEWIQGNVTIQYGNVSQITWTESAEELTPDANMTMRYWVDGKTLRIRYCQSGAKLPKRFHGKDLTITLPRSTKLDELDIENVSGSITVDNIEVRKTDLESVSGTITAKVTGRELKVENVSGDMTLTPGDQMKKLDAESVSGNITIMVGSKAAFTCEHSSVSGRFACELPGTTNGKILTVGKNPKLEIELETVSGNMKIED